MINRQLMARLGHAAGVLSHRRKEGATVRQPLSHFTLFPT